MTMTPSQRMTALIQENAQLKEQLNQFLPLPHVKVEPAPLSWVWRRGRSAVGPFVLLRVDTPLGSFNLFFDPDALDVLGKGAHEQARLARTGLVTPGDNGGTP